MRLLRGVLVGAVMASLLMVLASSGVAGATDGQDERPMRVRRECAHRSGPADAGLIASVTVNGGSAVGRASIAPGDLVEVTLSWDPSRFTGPPRKVVDCVYSDRGATHREGRGRRHRDLETIEGPVNAGAALNGRWTTRFVVPSRVVGRLLCQRGRLYGPAGPPGAPIRSNEVCLPVSGGPPPVIPEFPVPAIALASTALLACGTVLLLRRRAATA